MGLAARGRCGRWASRPMDRLAVDVKPPKRIRIGVHSYRVHHNRETVQRLKGEGRRGDSHPDQCAIAVDTDNPHSQAAETLFHEAMHCAWAQTALLSSDALEDHEEAVIASLSPVLVGMLRSNPKLVAYLTD